MKTIDPYQLDASRVAEPPATWSGKLLYCGPGFVLSASIVGSGELIATTTLGAEAGFQTLWVIIVSCLAKVALQLEFARNTIQSGETCMTALNRLPGARCRGTHWTIWFWLLLQPIKILQLGGIIGGLAMLLNIVTPAVSIPVWCWVVAVVVASLVCVERYQFIERASLLLLIVFTAMTLISVASLQWTPYSIGWDDLASGLKGELPAGALVFVFGTFGLTGVGGDEVMHYTYWLLEKGYAANVGPYRENDPVWQERARGWIKVMYLDALLSMVAYTIVTAAFFVLGAAVLHVRGEVPSGYAMVESLATMYTESLGPWARVVFLVGAFAVLFSTVFSALAAWTRITADAFSKIGLLRFENPISRRRMIAILSWFFPLTWAAVFLWYEQPVTMIMIGGLGTAAILLIVVVAALHFHFVRTLPGLEPGWFYRIAFLVSTISIVLLAGYGFYKAIL
ncbi:MAG: Nramp family divalent metal transporter [Planctomycetales bacterium]|nr:Nramp family divalent metal transporter [Planctomycetales bacterium]